VILLSLAEPPARILASRLSLRIRACSETLEVGADASDDEDGIGGVSAMLILLAVLEGWFGLASDKYLRLSTMVGGLRFEVRLSERPEF